MENIDKEIDDILKKLNEASRSYQERFIKPVIEHQEVSSHDFFELALAQDTINLLETQFKLLLTKRFPNSATPKSIQYLKSEEEKYKKKIELWKNREFPNSKKNN